MIYCWTHPWQHGIFCLMPWWEKKKWHTPTCLIPLDCLRIYASLGIFSVVPNVTSCLCFFFSCLSFVYSFGEKFFNAFTCSKQNNHKKIFQNWESLVAMMQWWNTMATVVKISCCLGILKLSRTLFVSCFFICFVVTISCLTFLRAFTCLIIIQNTFVLSQTF